MIRFNNKRVSDLIKCLEEVRDNRGDYLLCANRSSHFLIEFDDERQSLNIRTDSRKPSSKMAYPKHTKIDVEKNKKNSYCTLVEHYDKASKE